MEQNGGQQDLRRLATAPDDIWQGRHRRLPGNGEAATEIIPKRDTQFGAGLCQPEKGITTVSADIATGAAADRSLGYVASDVALGTVRMQWDIGVIQHGQQFGLVGMQTCQQAIKRDEAGAAAKDAIEADAKLPATAGRGVKAVRFQISIEPPDQRADMLLRDALLRGERVELMNQPLRVNPA